MTAIKTDFQTAPLAAVDRGMLEFAAKLTESPSKMCSADIDELRLLGFSDEGINDIVQVTALFAYYNRLADGLGIDLEPEMVPKPGSDI